MSVDYAERYPVRDVRLRADELDARRGLPLRRRATARSSTSAARPPTSASSQHGFPREASVAVEIGGVRTNFRMPDVLSIGLGGGRIVRRTRLRSGRDSVGYELTERALVFGGDDADRDRHRRGGRAGRASATRARAGLDRALVDAALARIEEQIAEAVDRMKTSAGADPGRRRRRRLDAARRLAAGRVRARQAGALRGRERDRRGDRAGRRRG